MKSRQAFAGGLILVAVACGLQGVLVSAQTPKPAAQPASPPTAREEFESRAELEAQLRTADSQHRTSEAFLLRNRLERGDFQEGDRIVIMLHSTAAVQKSETVTVRTGKIVPLPGMDDLKLEGVLRSELPGAVRSHMARYLKDPEVRTVPLMRIGVLGAVNRPGYFDTAADFLLSDAIMRAGGPSGDANLNGISIRRGATIIWGPVDTRTALSDGLSLDALHLRPGDEIVVASRRHVPWGTIITVTLSVLTLGVTLIRIR